jgi:hypothetical protein
MGSFHYTTTEACHLPSQTAGDESEDFCYASSFERLHHILARSRGKENIYMQAFQSLSYLTFACRNMRLALS